jgi:RNA polymerase primary sigma factor
MSSTSHTLPSFFIEEMQRHPILTRDEEAALAARIARGDEEAEHIMVKRNLRLAVKMAMEYGRMRYDSDDLISEACIGLQVTAKRFDPVKAKFSTYANFWVRRQLIQYMRKDGAFIRYPEVWGTQYRKIQRAVHALAVQGVDCPSLMEIAEEADIKPSHIKRFTEIAGASSIASLDEGVDSHNQESESLGSFIPDEAAACPAESAAWRDDYRAALEILATLPTRTQNLLRRRFGMVTGDVWTLENIGNCFHLTRERIRQLESQGLRKLHAGTAKANISEDRSALATDVTLALTDKKFMHRQKAKKPRAGAILLEKKKQSKGKIAQLDRAFASKAPYLVGST